MTEMVARCAPPIGATRLRIAVDNAEELVAVALFAMIAVVMFGQVVLRTVFSHPLPWPEELSQFLMTWGALLGAVGALKRAELVNITLLLPLLGERSKRFLPYIYLLLGAVVLGVLLVGGAEFTQRARLRAASLPITWFWGYLAIPVFAGLALVRSVQLTFGYRFVHVEELVPSVELTETI